MELGRGGEGRWGRVGWGTAERRRYGMTELNEVE